jgi:hypothetical protein
MFRIERMASMKGIITFNGNGTTYPKVIVRGLHKAVCPYLEPETYNYYAEKLRGRYDGFLVEIEPSMFLYEGANYRANIGNITELAGIEHIPFSINKATEEDWQCFIHHQCDKLPDKTVTYNVGIDFALERGSITEGAALGILIFNSAGNVVVRGIDKSIWPFPDDSTSARYAKKIHESSYIAFLVKVVFNNTCFQRKGNNYTAQIVNIIELAGIKYIPFDIDKTTEEGWVIYAKELADKNAPRFEFKIPTTYGPNQNGDDFSKVLERLRQETPKIKLTAEELRYREVANSYVTVPADDWATLAREEYKKYQARKQEGNRTNWVESTKAMEKDTKHKFDTEENKMAENKYYATREIRAANPVSLGIKEDELTERLEKQTVQDMVQDTVQDMIDKYGEMNNCIEDYFPDLRENSLSVKIRIICNRLRKLEATIRGLKLSKSDIRAMCSRRDNGTYLPRDQNPGLRRKHAASVKVYTENDEDYFTPDDPAYDFRTNRDPVFEKKK